MASLDPGAIVAQLTESFIKLPLAQKIIFPLLIVGSVSGIVFVSQWANQPEHVVLYSGLDSADAAAVIERLKDLKVDYEVRADGSTIAVSPPDVVHELRISLAGEGVPKGGVVGLEIFEATNLGTTTFQEKVKFLRAIQGELERTISSLEAVTSARIHITQPEKTVFKKEESQASASVLLKLRPGTELEKEQIKGIANLVAGSVEGLTRENVTIIDIYGNLLTPSGEEGQEELGADATRLQYVRQVERSYIERIEAMLARVLGPGKVVARVTADMDFSLNEREEESFDPGGGVIRSERSVEEGLGGSQRGGVPGVVSNLSNDPNLLQQPGASQNANRTESVKNYEVSRAIVKTVSPRGSLTRLSVAVLVDGTYAKAAATTDGAASQGEYKPLEPEVMEQIESLVKSAVGYDPVRGDTVTVENIPFHNPENTFAEVMASKELQDMIFNIIFRAGPLLFLLLFFFVIVKPLVSFLTTPTEAEVDLGRLLPTGIEELEKELETERTRAAIPDFEPSIDLDQLEELMAENSELVKGNPQQAALLIRYWLNDGRL